MSLDGSNKQRVRLGVVITAVIWLLPVCVHGASSVVLNEDLQFGFAETYFEKGEYYRAIGEYERFMHFFPESEKIELAKYRIGVSYLRGERYEEAIQRFQELIEEYGDSTYAIKSYFAISEANALLKRYDEALITLHNVLAIASDQRVRDEAYYQCGWVYLQKGMWEEARRCFGNISSQNRGKYRYDELMRELDKETLQRHKNPTTAGLLAIIPGAGHVYCERYREALVAFLVNGALIFAAYEAFDNDHDVLGGLITVVALGFYSGNIYSAVNSAHKFNEAEKNRFIRHLKDHAGISLAAGADRVMLSCKILF